MVVRHHDQTRSICMTTPNETPQESNSTLTESMNECESSPSSSPSVSIPKRPFRMRRLGERIFLVGISASLVGLGGFYIHITDLAFNYGTKLQNQMSSKEELTTELTEELVEEEVVLTPETPQPTTLTAVVTSDSLNVRKAGDENAEKIGILYRDHPVSVLEMDDTSPYVKIDFNGVDGYIHRDYIEFQ